MLRLTLLFLGVPAFAAHDSPLTAGIGAQYSFVSTGVRDGSDDAPAHQYGLVSRLKVVRFVGLEVATQLDQDPKTQRDRLLSPRWQVGLMANVLPTQHFNLFLVGGIGAHDAADLFDHTGATTSFHLGGGGEAFLTEHVALSADLRFRIPGTAGVEERVERSLLNDEPLPGLFDVWQLNFGFAYYL